MKRIICAIAAIAGMLLTTESKAQENNTEKKIKANHSADLLTISNKGICITSKDSSEKAAREQRRESKKFRMNYGLLDLGMSIMQDNTNYSDPTVTNLLNVPASRQNKSLFDMRTSKSVNVNIYPWMLKYKALKTANQRIYVTTGLGLQLYNFRYENPIDYRLNPPSITLDTISFKKNKLAIDYLSIPLMVTFKTKLQKGTWLVYGVGMTEGFKIGSRTKQISSQRGKQKEYGSFGLADFNTCLSAELGIEGIVRLFATYQVTNLFDNGLNQHPITIGFRIGGI